MDTSKRFLQTLGGRGMEEKIKDLELEIQDQIIGGLF